MRQGYPGNDLSRAVRTKRIPPVLEQRLLSLLHAVPRLRARLHDNHRLSTDATQLIEPVAERTRYDALLTRSFSEASRLSAPVLPAGFTAQVPLRPYRLGLRRRKDRHPKQRLAGRA